MSEYPKTASYDQRAQSHGSHQIAIENYYQETLLRPLTDEELAFLGELDLFFVAFTNRCGSTFLTSVLHQAGLAVPPRAEVFNSDMVINTSRDYEIPTFTDYFLKLTSGWERGKLAGFKASGHQLAWLSDTGLLSGLKSLHIIHCKRRDLLDQAISYHIANHTGQWQSLMEAQCQPEQVPYDGVAIDHLRKSIVQGNRDIDLFVSHHRLPSLEVFYEDCVNDSSACLQRIGQFLDCSAQLTTGIETDGIEIEKQGGQVNRDMRQRFLAEYPANQKP